MPKRGFRNPNHIAYTPLNLSTLMARVKQKRLDPSKARVRAAACAGRPGADGQQPPQAITMKDLRDSGAVSRSLAHDGVKLLGRARPGDCSMRCRQPAEAPRGRALRAAQAAEHFKALGLPLHLQVSSASASAREAVEAAGTGTRSMRCQEGAACAQHTECRQPCHASTQSHW